MAANMDTVGTFALGIELAKFQAITCMHKHYTVEEWDTFAAENPDALPYVAVSAGTGDRDLERVGEVVKRHPDIQFICLDIANGYSEHFVEVVKVMRQRHPEHIIIAGNVVTGEMVEELLLGGADIIKVGIGPGKIYLF